MSTLAPDGSILITPVSIPIHPVQLADTNQIGIGSYSVGTYEGGNQFIQAMPPDAGNTPIGWGGPFSLASTGVLFTVDTTGFTGIAVQITSAGGSNVITFEQSIDGQTWVATSGSSNAGNASYASTYNITGVFIFLCAGRYFRARVSTYTSGTSTIWYNLRQNSIQGLSPILGGTQSGQQSSTVVLSSSSSGGATYTRIASGTSASTVVIKGSAGTLYGIALLTPATATSTLTVYDNATTSSALIVFNPATTVLSGLTVPNFFTYGPFGINMTLGITAIIGTAASGDVLFMWK